MNAQSKNTEPSASTGVFVATLGALDHGQSLVDLDEAIRDLVRQVQEVGSKGKLVYTLELSPNGIGVGDVPLYCVKDDLKVTPPKKKRSGQTFFADEDFNLTRRHPGQQEMKLTAVPAKASNEPAGVHAAQQAAASAQ